MSSYVFCIVVVVSCIPLLWVWGERESRKLRRVSGGNRPFPRRLDGAALPRPGRSLGALPTPRREGRDGAPPFFDWSIDADE